MKDFIQKLYMIAKAPFLLVIGIVSDVFKIAWDLFKQGMSYVYEASDICVKNIIMTFREVNLQCRYWVRQSQSSRLFKPILILISSVAFVALFSTTLSSYFFIVQAGDRAVVTRFGKVDRYVDPGLGFKFPLVEKYYVVETEMIRELRFGFRQGPNLYAKMRRLSNPQEQYVMDVYQKSVESAEAASPGVFDEKGNLQNEMMRKQRMTHDYLRRNYTPPMDKSALAIKERAEIRERIENEAKRLGIRADGKISVPRERQLLTGDMSIVMLEWTLQFIVSDVKSYLFNSRDVEQNIRDVGLSVMNEVIGEFRLEEVITTGRKTIELAVQQRAQEILNEYDVGITVTQVVILNALPPKRVEFAFDEVNKAAQDMENLRYQAEIEYLRVIPEAEGKASRILKQAQAYAVEVINKAQGEAGQFSLVNKEYLKAPGITEDRIYIETMEKLFKNTPTIIMDKQVKGLMPIFMGQGAKKAKKSASIEKEIEKLVQSSGTFKEELKRFTTPNQRKYTPPSAMTTQRPTIANPVSMVSTPSPERQAPQQQIMPSNQGQTASTTAQPSITPPAVSTARELPPAQTAQTVNPVMTPQANRGQTSIQGGHPNAAMP